MGDMVQVICRECEAKLSLRGTPNQWANRKIRCPQCRAEFVAVSDTFGIADSSASAKSDSNRASGTARRKSPKPDRIESPDDDELPEAPRLGTARTKRAARKAEADDPATSSKKTKKKKSKSSAERSLGLALGLWTLGGICGGVIGGGLWGLIAYLTGWQVGFLAILIGTTVGIGVRLGAAQYEGWMPATTAVLLTLAAVFFSKLMLNYTLFYKDIADLGGGKVAAAMSQEELVAEYANEIVAPEFRQQGKPVVNPRLEDDDFAGDSERAMYDPAFWAEAEARWKALPAQEQAAFQQNLDDRAKGIDRQSLINRVAEQEIKPEFVRENKPVTLTGVELAADQGESQFPSELLQEAERRLDAKNPAERAALIESVRGETAAAEKVVQGMMLTFVLIYTLLGFLWPGTLICLVLACISAYQIGNYDGITT